VNQSKQWPSRPSWGWSIPSVVLPPLLAILLLPGAALGQLQSVRPVPDQGAVLREGVVIAPGHGVAYLMRPGGGIAAVDLASGTVRWRSDSAAKPLTLAGDRLIAQAESRGANALDLVVLDTRSGAARGSVRIPLPAGVVATVADTPAGSFRVQADSAASKLVVHWEATGITAAGPAQGYLPAESEGQAPADKAGRALAPRVVSGEAVVDLAAPSPRLKTAQAAPSEGSGAPTRAALEELRAPVVAGTAGRQLLSADGRHVLVTEPMDAPDFTLYRHRWTVYERSSGDRLGSVPAMVSATPFLVVGTTLYHAEPAHAVRREGRFVEQATALRAVNLETGAETWKAAVRETSFRGPFPP
jgi:hypothetical protein